MRGRIISLRHPNTKIAYVIKKVLGKLSKILEDYNDELEDIHIECCSVDEKGVIEYDVTKNASGHEIRHYRFTKDNLMEKRQKERELLKEWGGKDFEVEAFYTTEVPEDMTQEEKEALEGFVLQ